MADLAVSTPVCSFGAAGFHLAGNSKTFREFDQFDLIHRNWYIIRLKKRKRVFSYHYTFLFVLAGRGELGITRVD